MSKSAKYSEHPAETKPSGKNSVSAHQTYIQNLPTAVSAQEDIKQLKATIDQERINFQNMSHAALTVRDLLEAEIAGDFFASLFPDPLRAKLGIMELLINAIEHGNLEITSHQKISLLKENKWLEEITRRLSLRKYCCRRVHIYCSRHTKYVEILIKDEGRGFDWKDHLKPSPEQLTELNGRGITCANFIGFDKLEYIASGYMVKGRQYY